MVMGESKHPVSGTDYPGTFQKFDEWFTCENACLDYVAKVRWPDGFICPGCGFKGKDGVGQVRMREDCRD